MSRFRMYPTPPQEAALLEQCVHARYVWNLALEQWSMRTRDRGPTPGYVEQAQQLTEARAAFGWLRAGSQTVQQQALRDFDQAVRNFCAGTHRRPTWRKDWVEKTSTDLARRFDIIRVEDPRITQMTWRPKPKPDPEQPGSYLPSRRRAKAGLNRGILANGWGDLVFRCVACGHQANADVNAAINIAAGRAVSARRETPVRVSPKREPQLPTSA